MLLNCVVNCENVFFKKWQFNCFHTLISSGMKNNRLIQNLLTVDIFLPCDTRTSLRETKAEHWRTLLARMPPKAADWQADKLLNILLVG